MIDNEKKKIKVAKGWIEDAEAMEKIYAQFDEFTDSVEPYLELKEVLIDYLKLLDEKSNRKNILFKMATGENKNE